MCHAPNERPRVLDDHAERVLHRHQRLNLTRAFVDRHDERVTKQFLGDVVGGVAVENAAPGEFQVRYKSGKDLLRKTPQFYQQVMRDRLHRKFNRAYRYIEVLYSGQNPYIDAIRNNIAHLVRVIESDDWSLLRREPPYFLGIVNAVNEIEKLVSNQLSAMSGMKVNFETTALMPV